MQCHDLLSQRRLFCLSEARKHQPNRVARGRIRSSPFHRNFLPHPPSQPPTSADSAEPHLSSLARFPHVPPVYLPIVWNSALGNAPLPSHSSRGRQSPNRIWPPNWRAQTPPETNCSPLTNNYAQSCS